MGNFIADLRSLSSTNCFRVHCLPFSAYHAGFPSPPCPLSPPFIGARGSLAVPAKSFCWREDWNVPQIQHPGGMPEPSASSNQLAPLQRAMAKVIRVLYDSK